MKKQQTLMMAAIGLCIYLISTGLSFAAFSYFGGGQLTGEVAEPTPDPSSFLVDPNAPKTEECPINGKLFTKAERQIWETRRPLAVMIENHEESRPQSGLSSADVVYEAVAEGGITRFMGIFYCGVASPVAFAPVRSARVYYLPWVLEYDALYNHVGGAGRCNDPTVDERAKALCRIEEWKVKDMDQFGISFPTCYRNYDRLDHPVATEHTMVCFSDKLYELAAERGWEYEDKNGVAWDSEFEPWEFKDDEVESKRGDTTEISYVAWDGYANLYGAAWEYDSATNEYKRSTGGQAHLDHETGEQIRAKTVVILFAKETSGIDEHAHLLYDNIGTGKALVFADGDVTEGTWKKATRSDRTKFYDGSGDEISFNKGQVWISMLPTGTTVEY